MTLELFDRTLPKEKTAESDCQYDMRLLLLLLLLDYSTIVTCCISNTKMFWETLTLAQLNTEDLQCNDNNISSSNSSR